MPLRGMRNDVFSMLVVRDKLRFYRGCLRAAAGKHAEFSVARFKGPGAKAPSFFALLLRGLKAPAPSGFALSREGVARVANTVEPGAR